MKKCTYILERLKMWPATFAPANAPRSANNSIQNKHDQIRQRQSSFRCGAVVLLLLSAITFNLGAANAKPHADLSRLVIIGDSLLAGYQNGSLMGSQQTNGIAALIARQAKVDLALPLIAEPGIPNVLTLVKAGPPPEIALAPGVSTGVSICLRKR